MKTYSCKLVSACALAFPLALVGAVTVAQDETLAPAFSLEQQTDGQNQFLLNCATGCHQPDMAGVGPIAPLRGERFLSSFGNRTVGELTTAIRTAMPPTNVGGLSQETYLNIVAYILAMNGGQPGLNPLGLESPLLVSAVTDPAVATQPMAAAGTAAPGQPG